MPVAKKDPSGYNPKPASIAISPATVAFGTVVASVDAQQTVTVRCSGDFGTASVSAIAVTGVFTLSGLPGFPRVMAPGDFFTFQVHINHAAGTFAGTLTVTSSRNSPTANVTATTGGTNISVVPPSASFVQTVFGFASNVIPITITNNSGAPINLTGASSDNPDLGFFGAPPAFPVTIANGGNTVINLVANPSSLGLEVGTLTITTNVGGFTITIAMSVVTIQFIEINQLLGSTFNFVLGFSGAAAIVELSDPSNFNSELASSFTFNNPAWDALGSEKTLQRLEMYYENIGICTLKLTWSIWRPTLNGGLGGYDTGNDTITFGDALADGKARSAFFDVCATGELIDITISKAVNAGPCSILGFTPHFADRGEKVEGV